MEALSEVMHSWYVWKRTEKMCSTNVSGFPVDFKANEAWGSVHVMPEEYENAFLFLRLGLPSTLIRHENGAFQKSSSNCRNLKTSAFRFRVDGKLFENEAFRKRWHYGNHVISLTEFSSSTNPKRPEIVACLIYSGVVWTENIWCVSRVKPSF